MFKQKKLAYYFFALFILCLLLILFFSQNTIIKTLDSFKLLPREETFTELYFNNHITLPSKVEIDKPYTFSFTVHNLEQKPTTYPYEIYTETQDHQKTILDQKSFTLLHNKTKTIQESFSLASISGRLKVVVNLKNKQQLIDFWIHE